MEEWEGLFDHYNLEHGKAMVLNDQVRYYAKTKSGCTAMVSGRVNSEVSIRLDQGKFRKGYCNCPSSRGGRNCAHVAAVMYYHDLAERAAAEGKSTELALREWIIAEKNRQEEAVHREKSATKQSVKRTETEAEREKTPVQGYKNTVGVKQYQEMTAEREHLNQEQTAESESVKKAQSAKLNHLKQEQAAERERIKQEQAAERERIKQEQAAERERIKQEQAAQEERLKQEQAAQAKRLKLEQEQREQKRREREERKRIKAEKEAEKKRRQAELLEEENRKRAAEEERRAKIREEKAQEARRKEEKRKQEQEMARKLANQKEKELQKKQLAQKKEQERKEKLEREKKEREEAARREQMEREERERKEQEAARLQEQRRKEERSEKYLLLGEPTEQQEDEWDGSGRLSDLETYRYYRADLIEKSVKVKKEKLKEGETLLRTQKVVIDRITSGFDSYSERTMGAIFATASKGKEQFPVSIYFTRNKVESTRCQCPQCRKIYYYWTEDSLCSYEAAVFQYLIRYLKTHSLGDSTDIKASRFLNRFQDRKAQNLLQEREKKTEALQLVPRILKKDTGLSLSFRYGSSKLYVVKNLGDFCTHVKNTETAVYGTNTELPHDLKLFTESGKKWFHLLRQVVQEEQVFEGKLMSRGYDLNLSGGNSMELSGWRLDAVYEMLEKEPIAFEDWTREPKTKTTLRRGEKNPQLSVVISPEQEKNGGAFHGIYVTILVPEIYPGTDTAYFLEDDRLLKISSEYYRKMEMVANSAVNGVVSLHIGRNNLSRFYYHVLPELQEISQVVETDAETIRSYLISKGKFVFYLDTEGELILGRVSVIYEDREFDLLADLAEDFKNTEEYRDDFSEKRALSVLLEYLTCFDPVRCVLHNNGEEESAYQLFAYGLDQLQQLGEVHCTRQFLNQKKMRKVKASVGVSVSEGMLDLKITTENLDEQELLDLLAGYRQKRKYYRLKDGSFVDLQDDNLQVLSELVDSLRLKASDLKKEVLRLPMFRGLYLDKLLEANDSLYEDRDAVIRRMAAQFKSIEDAEYEVPASLKKTMRGYQKEGFQWLKTLESWGFGGILADEMGLGKTLQAISLLLSQKEEGKEGTSLIVCPASLVYNWEEEIHRFAPRLTVQTITGTQEERAERLRKEDMDVWVTSYDLLKRDIVLYEKKKFLTEIIDEAQYIKNHLTAAAKSVKAVTAGRRFALTGTPVENRLSELWSIFDYLMPGFLFGYEIFRRDYENPIVKSSDEEKMQRLQKMTGPFILRRCKEDVLKELPEKLEEVRYVRLEKKQQKLYDAQVIQLRRQIGAQSDQEFSQSRLQILAALTRLRQLCCDPALCLEGYQGETAKTQACIDLIHQAIDGGHRLLVFSQFTSMLEILEGYLQKEEIAYYVLMGSTSKEERRRLVKEFNEGTVPVFLISLKAGGVGLNLTGADIVIHYDPWWNLAAQNQATDRAHRIGQTRKVTVYKLIAKDTIEEKILKLQEKKKQLADQILGGESGQLGSLSREELMDIIS